MTETTPTLDPDRWQAAKTLLQKVLAVAPSERGQFLAQVTVDDPALRTEVEALLKAHDEAPGFLEASAGELLGLPHRTEETTRAGGEDLAGGRIGVYRIVRALGHGGMGTVYLAERDDAFHRQVALKLVARGMDTDAILRRFDLEREILARLDHPEIARLFDGGSTADGRPYFVMELVDGEPIDRYCRDHALDVEQKLRLFLKVCGAVHYAHQNLVVHRDLKPANILVTAGGEPKLLDFGIAKLLDPRGGAGPVPTVDLTAVARPMTPEYASPEQIRGEAITTASDVYSLGVLLAQLLTGTLPLPEARTTRPSAALSAVPTAEREALRRKLRGDLDTIVLRALRLEPERRYASAERLAADLERHLGGLPVEARPDTFGYRGGKFLRRHRWGVAAAALIAAALVATTSIAVIQARRAERRFQDVRHLATYFLFEFHDAIQELPGATPARELVVRKALEYLDGLAVEAGGDRSLQAELAAAYQKVGDVQGLPHWASLGHTDDALRSYEKALALLERLVRARPANLEWQLAIAEVKTRIGSVQETRGKAGEARALRREALAITRGLWERERYAPARRAAIVDQVAVADDLFVSGDREGARAAYRLALAATEARLRDEPANNDARRHVGVIEQRLGDSARDLGMWDEAVVHDRASLAVDEALAAAGSPSAENQRDLATDHTRLAVSQHQSGHLEASLAENLRALALRRSLREADPKDSRAANDLAESLALIAVVRGDLGQRDASFASWRESLALRRQLVTEDPKNVHWSDNLASDLLRYGESLIAAGQRETGRASLRESLALRERLTSLAPTFNDNRVHLGILDAAIGRSLITAGAVPSAEACTWLARGAELSAESRKRAWAVGEDVGLAARAERDATQCAAVPPR